MQRYTPYVDYENLHDDELDVTVLPQEDGAWVPYSEARAEIELLEKEVERIKQTKNMWRDGFKRVMHERDTAWNDAIEAAAEKVNTLAADHSTILWAVNEILAMKRSQE